MARRLGSRHTVLGFVCILLALPVAGGECEIEGPPIGGGVVVREPPVVIVEPPGPIIVEPDAFGIDLVNETAFTVDPGVFIDEFFLDLGLLAPFEGTDIPIPFDIDCFPGDTLTIDPILFLSPVDEALAANGPVVLLEGIDYLCGDIITLFFFQDVTGAFFVDVAVNGVLLGF